MAWYNLNLDSGKVIENMRTFAEVDLKGLNTCWSWQMRGSDLGALWMADYLCAKEDKQKGRTREKVNGDYSRIGYFSATLPEISLPFPFTPAPDVLLLTANPWEQPEPGSLHQEPT